MGRFLTFLAIGLVVVGCDNPDAGGDAAFSSKRTSRARHPAREPSPGTPAYLRKTLQAATLIECPESREKALADVAWNALETDPDLACEAFLKLPQDGAEKLRLIQHYAMRLAEQDPEAAIAWAATLGTEQETAQAHGHIALTLAESDPEGAATLLSDTGIGGRGFDMVVVQVLQRWAAQSPSDAAGWVTLFPPGPAREAGTKIIADKWLQTDARAAFSWLAAIGDPTVRKEAALGLEMSVLQQPKDIRETWLQHADGSIRSELEQQRELAIKEVGDNIPPP